MIKEFINTVFEKYGRGKNLTICDIGSRDLNESVEFRRVFPDASIIAFEPNPRQYAECSLKAMRNNIEFYPYAVSDKDGLVSFLPIDMEKSPIKNVGASSLLPITEVYRQRENLLQAPPISVKSCRIDTFCKDHNIKNIDCAWIDVQGMGFEVLKGFGDLLNSLQVLHIELEYVEMYKGEKLYPEVNEFLLASGFKNINTPIYNSRDFLMIFCMFGA
jgi:FkbM family methyltransferase